MAMPKRTNAVVVGNDSAYRSWLVPVFTSVIISNNLRAHIDDVGVFTGGPDVFPGFYKREALHQTFYDIKRDQKELKQYRYAKEHGIPCIGICRGAQLLNVANGGELYQHVTNHTRNHVMYTKDGKEFTVNSTHHQMMVPTAEGEVLAWALGESNEYHGLDSSLPVDKDTGKYIEPEIVWYPKTKDLCIQCHPERFSFDEDRMSYMHELVRTLIKEN